MPIAIQEKPEGLVFKLRVQPRSSRNQVAGLFGDALKIHLTAPPVDQAANQACIAFLAGLLSVNRSAVTIRSGQTARNKLVMVRCPPAGGERDALRAMIRSLAGQ
jgi:uncharacterized protein